MKTGHCSPAVETLIPVVEQTLARLPETAYNIFCRLSIDQNPTI